MSNKQTVREVTYEAEALTAWLRSLLVDLNKGDIAAAKQALRDAIDKINSQHRMQGRMQKPARK